MSYVIDYVVLVPIKMLLSLKLLVDVYNYWPTINDIKI